MRIGIFFGGRSREREVSFAGGRTVYDNLNKSLFTPVPIFVDSCGNFIQLDWQYVYKGTIRDFYPPANFIPDTDKNFQIYIESLQNLSETDWELLISQVGKQIEPKDFSKLIDFAFLTLHGPYGEDGSLQGLLEWYDIPYSGSGILPSAIGISKTAQKQFFGRMGFDTPNWTVIIKSDYDQNTDKQSLLNDLVAKLGLPMVFKAPHQGSSIGVSILEQNDVQAFELAIAKAFFQRKFNATEWLNLTEDEKVFVIAQLADIREGLGMPLIANGDLLHHPQELFDTFEREFAGGIDSILLESPDAESAILAESFIDGKEFSCIVIEDENGEPLALPPTQILKKSNFFDYKAKYLPGISRKITPIKVPTEQIQSIRKACEDLYKAMGGEVYARIDGFIQEDGKVFLNDPNTTSGMLPSSFFFHQAAEIGLNPSQFLTYIIRTSLACRMSGGKAAKAIASHLSDLDLRVSELQDQLDEKLKVAVIMGGFSSERHISVESGRNIYEKLASSTKYLPIPIFLSGKEGAHELHQIPVNILLKDNADDIYDKIHSFQADREHPVLLSIREEAGGLSRQYATKGSLALHKLSYAALAEICDVVFIALHGRPGEDGAVQVELEKVGLPYNGSGVESSQITINKYATNQILRKHGILVAGHALVYQHDWEQDTNRVIAQLEEQFQYPIIAKPADDGCSSAVKKIKNREELIAYARIAFRSQAPFPIEESRLLKLKPTEEFPQKNFFLVEDLISANGAARFLEVTGGLLTNVGADGNIEYTVFEASEALAQGEVLSLEEKFLAGEGQNITPARYAKDKTENQRISDEVKSTLTKVAKILNIEGYARIDAFVRIFADGKIETIIIEVNSLPGMTPATCIFHQAAIENYKPFEFIDAILNYGIHKLDLSKSS